MHIVSVLVLIYMIDPSSVERRGAPDNPVDGVAFAQQELGEIGAVLPSDACDKGYAWLKWTDTVPAYAVPKGAKFNDIFVSTEDTSVPQD